MEKRKIRWEQKGNTGTMLLKWWVERGKVKVNLDGDIPHILGWKDQRPSREASKRCYELLYAASIKKYLNDNGHDYE